MTVRSMLIFYKAAPVSSSIKKHANDYVRKSKVS